MKRIASLPFLIISFLTLVICCLFIGFNFWLGLGLTLTLYFIWWSVVVHYAYKDITKTTEHEEAH
jgi:hypothetical protein